MTDDDEPAVKITLRAIYEKQLEQGSILQTLSDSLPAHVAATAEDVREIRAVATDHEARVRILEAARWKQVGMYSALTVIVAVAEAVYYTTVHK